MLDNTTRQAVASDLTVLAEIAAYRTVDDTAILVANICGSLGIPVSEIRNKCVGPLADGLAFYVLAECERRRVHAYVPGYCHGPSTCRPMHCACTRPADNPTEYTTALQRAYLSITNV